MRNFRNRPTLSQQYGVALFIVLIFLIALTILALSSMRGATIGERMARNSVDKSIAMQAAEAALRDAESDILWRRADGTLCTIQNHLHCRSDTVRPIIGEPIKRGFHGDALCTDGECLADINNYFTVPVWLDPTKLAKAVVFGTYTGATPLSMVSKQPIYLIEGFFSKGEYKTFRISAVGYGADSNTQVVLQSIFNPKFQ